MFEGIEVVTSCVIGIEVKIVKPAIIYEDNQSTVRICENDVLHSSMKHVEVRYHYVRDDVKSGVVGIRWIPTQDQLADIFTKSTSTATFEKHRDILMSKIPNHNVVSCETIVVDQRS